MGTSSKGIETGESAASYGSGEFREGLLSEIPSLRAFAISLCGTIHQADDLVQDTLLKAWEHSRKFEPGSNLRAWLFTILRNIYFSLHRRRRREVEDANGIYSNSIATPPPQQSAIELTELRAAMAKLAEDQREVLMLVGASGFSYEETAEICGIAVGTVKSRLNRARNRLAELLEIFGPEDVGGDRFQNRSLGAATERHVLERN